MIVIAFIGQKPYGKAVSCICTTLWNIWHFAGGFLHPHAKHCQPLGLQVYARVYAYVYCTVDKQYPELWNVRILAYNSCLSGMRNATWHSSLSLITAWHAPNTWHAIYWRPSNACSLLWHCCHTDDLSELSCGRNTYTFIHHSGRHIKT